jgi:hypothetical protein
MEKECRAKGGRVGMVASGNPDVIREAEGKEDYAKGNQRKRGGKVKKDMMAEGKKAAHRMDRPKRASGGRVGADKNPFSSARAATKTGDRSSGEPD